MNPVSLRDTHGSVSQRPFPDTPQVFVVDDDVSIRESLECLIRSAGWQAETFASGEEFLSHPRVSVPGCVILDYRLPHLDGLSVQKHLVADSASLPIIFVTYYGDPAMAVAAMKGGAFDVLTKPFGDDVLLNTVQQAIGRSRKVLVRQAELQILRDRFRLLSERERQVMTLAVSGLLNKQIGGELNISEITVKAHRGRAMDKMQATSIADLVNMAIKLGLGSAGQP